MRKIQLFNVAPAVPPQLQFLEQLTDNLWWCWDSGAVELFRRMDPNLWRECDHNPKELLARLPQERLEALAQDGGFLQHQEMVRERFERMVASAAETHTKSGCIAYFSLEYGIHESLRLYSGGLGILAGDHLKSASDLGLPLVAIGLLYRQGYFHQMLNPDGWQLENYPENVMQFLPVKPACDEQGRPVQISLQLPEGRVAAAVWLLDLGRIHAYMLDTNIPENPPEFRTITAQLYGGDRRTRLRQELILGVGGIHALRALGYNPAVCHINEGHAAFLSLARASNLMKAEGLEFETALEVVRNTNVFTTHTPVPAGNESFTLDLLRPHLEALSHELGIDPERVIAMGQCKGAGSEGELSMTILGLRMSKYANGVSRLHGRVSREMWSALWPEAPADEIPITHVTNGVHPPSWLSSEHADLYDRYLGASWRSPDTVHEAMAHVDRMPAEELWRVHELCRSRLIRMVREHLEKYLMMRNASRSDIAHARSVLDHDALTIGFARRFATYKRATLLLHDRERFAELLRSADRPLQFIFAGKAHPADHEGKRVLQELIHFTREADVCRRIVFLENYDVRIARHLVQGCDVWLNTPRRPQEASGTSGMKACINGGLHASTLDGWWAEADLASGWTIGDGEEYNDPHYQDRVEAQALYNIIENEILRTFYDRSVGDIPCSWVELMRRSLKMALEQFSSDRMVAEYSRRFYTPAIAAYQDLLAEKAEKARGMVAQRKRLRSQWQHAWIGAPEVERDITNVHVGDRFQVHTRVGLGQLTPEEVDVQVYYGPVDSRNRITESHNLLMEKAEDLGNGEFLYQSEILCERSGRYGYTARVKAGGAWGDIAPDLIKWATP